MNMMSKLAAPQREGLSVRSLRSRRARIVAWFNASLAWLFMLSSGAFCAGVFFYLIGEANDRAAVAEQRAATAEANAQGWQMSLEGNNVAVKEMASALDRMSDAQAANDAAWVEARTALVRATNGLELSAATLARVRTPQVPQRLAAETAASSVEPAAGGAYVPLDLAAQRIH